MEKLKEWFYFMFNEEEYINLKINQNRRKIMAKYSVKINRIRKEITESKQRIEKQKKELGL